MTVGGTDSIHAGTSSSCNVNEVKLKTKATLMTTEYHDAFLYILLALSIYFLLPRYHRYSINRFLTPLQFYTYEWDTSIAF